MTASFISSTGRLITLASKLGEGGEGDVYQVQGSATEAVKLYKPQLQTPERERKLEAMIIDPPEDRTRSLTPPHISIAWPTELVYAVSSRRFVGFVMPMIDKSPNIFEIYNPSLRAKKYAEFTWSDLHQVATNFAIALASLHAVGHIMGDVNQKNVLVNSTGPNAGFVSLIDTDSFQVKDVRDGGVYRCLVGVGEYTPPELQGRKFDSVDRTITHDCFGLAVIIFQLLMQGYHPYAGAAKDVQKSHLAPTPDERIKSGVFPYQANLELNPPPKAPDFQALHPAVRNLFIRCFVDGHHNPSLRPTTREWFTTLEIAKQDLVQCRNNESHWYARSFGRCHWCNPQSSQPTVAVTQSKPGAVKSFTENLGNGVVLEMVLIPGGTFLMGSPSREEQRKPDEGPQRRVTVPAFAMGCCVVTQSQYAAIMGTNPARFKGDNRPVEQVSWDDAVEFCQRLSRKTGRTYRLPSEAEWEYACRAGTTTPFHFGETLTTDLANYNGNYTYGNGAKGKYLKQTADVGSYPPNGFGLYEMHGNVWEWCADYWHKNYNGAPTDGSAWVTGGESNWRIFRGGSWGNDPQLCRSAARDWLNPGNRSPIVGFRVVAVLA